MIMPTKHNYSKILYKNSSQIKVKFSKYDEFIILIISLLIMFLYVKCNP